MPLARSLLVGHAPGCDAARGHSRSRTKRYRTHLGRVGLRMLGWDARTAMGPFLRLCVLPEHQPRTRTDLAPGGWPRARPAVACTELPPLMLRQGRHAGEDLRVLGRHMHTERGC